MRLATATGWFLAVLLAAVLGLQDRLDRLRVEALTTGELRQDLSLRETAIFQAEAALAGVLHAPTSEETPGRLRQASALLNVASASLGWGFLHDPPLIATLERLNWAEYQAAWSLDALADRLGSQGPLGSSDIRRLHVLDEALIVFSTATPRITVHPTSSGARGGFVTATNALARALERFALAYQHAPH